MSATDGKPAPERRISFLTCVPGMIIGAILGCSAGFGGGLLAGIAIARFTQMSCFEGACSYFAVLLGVGCGLAGFVLGPVIAWRITRRMGERAS